MSFLCWTEAALAIFCAVSFLTYLVPYLLDLFVFKEQDLKKKYNTKWAVVTGASSGIGRAITEKLAEQGLNVAMVALDDDTFKNTHKDLQKKFPKVELRRIGVNLGGPASGYMPAIIDGTKDITPPPALIFNNAGFVATGLFADSSIDKQMANYECNAISPVRITHHFAARILSEIAASPTRGAIFFTSSPAGFMPCPITVMYGATKAFLTEFATSIAAELKYDGVDVLVVHPSPVNTNFYSGNSHDIGAMNFFKKTATTPLTIASCFFRSIGRTVVHDQGYFPVVQRILLKLIDYNLLAWLTSRAASGGADFMKLIAARSAVKKSS